jgi:hypothetical protein
MSRRKKQEVAPSIFRFMCIKTDSKNYTADFQSKDEAIQYAESLYDPKMEWYGIYEISPIKDGLITVAHKRLIPHNDTIIYERPKEEKEVKRRRKRVSRNR